VVRGALRGATHTRAGPAGRSKLLPVTRPRRLHRSGTVLLSLAMLVIGVALIVQTVAGSGSGAPVRVILGVLFVAAGAGRLWLESRRATR